MPLADRRVAARFEVVGELWGSMQALQPLRLTQGAQSVDLRATVRHMSPVEYGGGIRRYRVGLEFFNLTDQAAAWIGSLMDEHQQDGSRDEA